MAQRANIEDDPTIKSYIDDALGATDTGGDNDTSGSDDTGQAGSQDQSGQQQPDGQQGTTPKQDQGQAAPKQDSGSGQPNGQPKQDDQKQAKESPVRPGDLKLPDGSIVRAGAERRMYENMRIARDQASSFEKRSLAHEQTITQLQQQIKTHETALQAAGSSNPQELSDSLRLFRDMRTNPVGTIKTLLAELAGSGIDLNGIVQGLDVAAMKTMLDQRLGQQQQQQQQQVNPAEQEARQFLTEHPDALQHNDVIIGLAKQHPQMSLEQLYWELRKNVANNGYDWSQPLAPQYQARQQQQQQSQQRKPMPNGNGGTQMQDATDVIAKQTSGTDESYDDIIRGAIKDVGYTYRK